MRLALPSRPSLALALTAALAACSATSEPIGNGACDGFCTKVVNLRCQVTLTLEDCVARCVDEQRRCPVSESEVIRCASNEGAMSCDPTSRAAHVVNCDAARQARDVCFADSGVSTVGPLPPGL